MTVGNDTLYFAYDASGSPMTVTYNGTNYSYATNLQGDNTAILDTSGTAVVEYTYDAWGNHLTTTGTMTETLGAVNPLRYRGYVYDRETTLYYLQSRYYDPNLGRFINADSYASTGQGVLGNNMFAYCQNSPVMNYDPTGHFRVNLQYKELEGGIGGPGGGDNGGAGGGAILLGFIHLLENGKQALVNLTSLLALVQTLKFSSNNGEYFLYVLYDTDKDIQYVGRTKDPDARESAHKLNPNRKGLTFQIVGYNLNYFQVRGLEQVLMLYCHTIDKSSPKNNQINGVSPNNNNITDYLAAAEGALGYAWNQFSNEVLCWLGQ